MPTTWMATFMVGRTIFSLSLRDRTSILSILSERHTPRPWLRAPLSGFLIHEGENVILRALGSRACVSREGTVAQTSLSLSAVAAHSARGSLRAAAIVAKSQK